MTTRDRFSPKNPARKWRWTGRIGHPRQLMAGIVSFLEDAGYQVEEPVFTESKSQLDGVATFEGLIRASRGVGHTALLQLVAGALLIPVILGFRLIANALKRPYLTVEVQFSGEEYWAGVRGAPGQVEAQRTGVVSDVRVVVNVELEYPRWRLTKPHLPDIEASVDELRGFLEDHRADSVLDVRGGEPGPKILSHGHNPYSLRSPKQ